MEDTGKKNGGKREGAGRKFGTGPYREDTSVMRVPNSQKPLISSFLDAYAKRQKLAALKENLDRIQEFTWPALDTQPVSLPLYQSKVPAGFPSPADDHVEDRLDPTEYLIDQAETTFFVTIQGESMSEAGLIPGDKAVIDRERIPTIGNIVLAMIDGEFTIKTLSKQKNGLPKLLPANSSGKYAPIIIKEGMQFEVWGVVTGSFRRFV